MAKNQIEFHEYCSLFPPASDQEQSELAESILNEGQDQPIIMFEGKILDGRNRYLACLKVGVEPVFREYQGDDPLDYVMRCNLYRRQLTPSQRADVGSAYYKAARKAGKHISRKEVAERFGVGERTLDRAVLVNEFTTEEVRQKIASGELAISQVENAIKQVQDEKGVPKKAGLSVADAAGEALSAEMRARVDELVKTDPESLKPKQTQESKRATRKAKLQEETVPNDEEPEVESEWSKNFKPDPNLVAFNDQVLAGAYDGRLWEKQIREINDIMTRTQTLPDLFNSCLELSQSFHNETTLKMVLNMIVQMFDDPIKRFLDTKINVRQMKDMITTLIAEVNKLGMFDIADVDRCVEGEVLDAIRQKYAEGCKRVKKEAERLRDKIQAAHAASKNASVLNATESNEQTEEY